MQDLSAACELKKAVFSQNVQYESTHKTLAKFWAKLRGLLYTPGLPVSITSFSCPSSLGSNPLLNLTLRVDLIFLSQVTV